MKNEQNARILRDIFHKYFSPEFWMAIPGYKAETERTGPQQPTPTTSYRHRSRAQSC